jgi:hypothetical protein
MVRTQNWFIWNVIQGAIQLEILVALKGGFVTLLRHSFLFAGLTIT